MAISRDCSLDQLLEIQLNSLTAEEFREETARRRRGRITVADLVIRQAIKRILYMLAAARPGVFLARPTHHSTTHALFPLSNLTLLIT